MSCVLIWIEISATHAVDEITDLNTPQGDVDYTYNLAGQILTLVDVGTGTTTNTYDSAGRPATTTDAFGDVSTYSYDSAGRLSQKNNPNGTYEVYSYDSRNRVTSIVTKDSSGTTLQSRVYTFDLASQVTQVVEGGVTTTFGYDNIGQLTSESKSSGYSGAYTYDANGNRLTRTVNSVTESYSYDAGDKLTGITGGSDARSFTYDAAGRTTGIVRSSGTTAFSYDFESRVTSITKPGMTTNSFSYNGLDTRTSLTDSTGTKTFKRAGVGVTAPVLSDGTANFTPSGEKRGSVKTTFHSALKNDDVQTSSSQAVSASKQFDAFGNELSGSGSWKSQFGYAGGFGYQSDPDSGLKLLGHRYYDSDTGRFLTRDPAKDGENWYSYCYNDPIRRNDASGLAAVLLVVAVVAIFMVLSTPPAHAPSYSGQADDHDPTQSVQTKLELIELIVSRRGKPRGKMPRPKPPQISSQPKIGPGSKGGPTAGNGFNKKTKKEARQKSRDKDGKERCAYCGMEALIPEIDHIIPISKGGNAEPSNAHLTCRFCNRSKGNGTFPKNAPPGFMGDWPPPWW